MAKFKHFRKKPANQNCNCKYFKNALIWENALRLVSECSAFRQPRKNVNIERYGIMAEPVLVCGCKPESLTLRRREPRVFEKRTLRYIFELKRRE